MSRNVSRLVFPLVLAVHVLLSTNASALPKRLILLVDGVAYRDMKALQEGVSYTDRKGRQFHRQGFQEGYFPVSRLVSTFPSASDVAWTEIFGNRPVPGYQRTYFNAVEDAEVFQNGVTTSVEYEKQMTWQVEGGCRRTLSYVLPQRAYQYELNALVADFLQTRSQHDNYYALIRSTDSAQHLSGDIFAMLGALDEKLQKLRALYRAREGRDLEILVLSDHGNNHAGPGQRVAIRSFLKKAGYRITKSIRQPKDVVIPTAGIESWVELHNAPSETERLVAILSHLEGVDVLTAQDPGQADRFIVMNSRGERASIEWNSARNSFLYSPEVGDPIDYLPVVDALARKNRLDADGFATADAWMAETLSHRYPLAPERIVRGHTRVTLNPATILISLNNDYVHAGWLIRKGAKLARIGGTHGALDERNSNGILLSNIGPTKDTSTSRVAALFDGFAGLRDYRAEENGAEWVARKDRVMGAIARAPLALGQGVLPNEAPFLRIWTPRFTHLGREAPVDVAVERIRQFRTAQIRRGDSEPMSASERHWTLNLPLPCRDGRPYERVYAFPAELMLEPEKCYRLSGRIRDQKKSIQIFEFAFRTDRRGIPRAD